MTCTIGPIGKYFCEILIKKYKCFHPENVFDNVICKIATKRAACWHERINHDTLQWRHNERVGVSNNRRLDGLHNRLFRRRSKKTPKLHGTGPCAGNSQVTGEFPAQRASNVENVSIWWRHHEISCCLVTDPQLLDLDKGHLANTQTNKTPAHYKTSVKSMPTRTHFERFYFYS